MSSNGSRARDYVDKLATETWVTCWAFCGRAELRHLSLVCRFFRPICQSLLFRRQSVNAPNVGVDGDSWMDSFAMLQTRTEALNQLATSAHAASVRQWHFWGDRGVDDRLKDTWLVLITMFTTTLGAYRRLTVLNLDYFTIDAKVRAVLPSLESLEVLSLWECDVACPTGDVLLLKTFKVAGWSDIRPADQLGPLHIVSPQNVQRLIVGGSIDGKALLLDLDPHPLPSLIYLSVTLTTRVTDLFFACLDSCPQLESLYIRQNASVTELWDLPDTATFPDQLLSTTLPVLRYFKGPHNLVGLFASGRPIESVHLTGALAGIKVVDILSALSSISHSSAPLHLLAMGASFPHTASPEIFTAIGSLFPDLRRLTIQLDDKFVEHEFAPSSDESGSDREGDSGSAEDEEQSGNDEEEDDSAVEQVDAQAEPPGSPDGHPSSSIELPGFVYISGTPRAPDPERRLPETDSSPLTFVMDFIHTGLIILPPNLEVLHFMQMPPWNVQTPFERYEQYQAILSLERLVPSLKEVAFGDFQDCWVRDHHVWWDRDFWPNRSPIKLISLVWNADGTRRNVAEANSTRPVTSIRSNDE